MFYERRQETRTFLRVHQIPGALDFFDHSLRDVFPFRPSRVTWASHRGKLPDVDLKQKTRAAQRAAGAARLAGRAERPRSIVALSSSRRFGPPARPPARPPGRVVPVRAHHHVPPG